MAVFGLARKGGHIITSCLEHNAVLRPLYSLRDRGYISLTVLPCNSDYLIDPHDIGDAIRRSTCLVVMNHASNVTGTVQSLDEIYGVCEQNEVPVLFDMSQSAGAFDINLGKKPLLIGAFTGHKSLMGPPGIGGLVVGEDVYITPTKFGGTGVFSERESMPNDFPSQLEPGTPNFPGIAGLCAGVRFIKEHGAAELAKKRIALVRNLCSFLSGDGYSMYTAQPDVNPCGVVSFCMDNWNCEDVGYILNHSFDIRIRTGLHCTPLIHKFTHTYPEGTIRVSFSCFNTDSEVNHLKDALTRIKEYT
jgi:selenocysteine lyase/cysteine desulfurase